MRGFTLVELVVVMVVLGILSIGTVQFLTDSSDGYAATVSRSELATSTRFAVNRVATEVRDALPNSIRISGTCLEFIPIIAASTYLDLPLATAATSFQAVPLDPAAVPAGARTAVFPDTNIYQLTSPATVSPTVAVSAPNASNEVTVTMSSAHRFAAPSPFNRFYLVDDPVSFCVDGGRLWRYSGYGFTATQPTGGSLPGAMPGRALIAQNVSAAMPFTLNDPTLTRNAVVDIDLTFAQAGDALRVEHSVQIRNVP